jgi:DNA-binding NarL/FixJ family response regulator
VDRDHPPVVRTPAAGIAVPGNLPGALAEILDVRGAWEEAEIEAVGVCRDMERIDVFVVADGMYALGELRRRRGDFDGAQEAYERAHAIGRDPQPGLALLRLAQGRHDVAMLSIASALAGFGASTLERAPLLAAQCEIALAAGDLDLADAAATEVTRIAAMFESVGLEATGARGRGAVALARDDPTTALAALRMAAGHCLHVDAPYEVARTRVLLARALRALGDEDAAIRECAAARSCFEQLGAASDLAAIDDAPDSPPCGLTAREVEVLQQVAAAASNREVALELFISEKTVARHVSNIDVKLDVTSRAAATAFAYRSGLL